MITLALLIAIISAVVYLLCDKAENARLSAVQELARLAFVASMVAWLLK